MVKTNFNILESREISFTFVPQTMTRQYTCILELTGTTSKELKWKYPITGIPEVHPYMKDIASLQLSCKSRLSIERSVQLKLTELPMTSSTNLQGLFNTELVIHKDYSHNALAVEKSLSVEITKASLSYESEAVLDLNLIYTPLKSLKVNAELIINRIGGGRWLFPLTLESTEPDIDDTISIESTVGKTSGISFRLVNQFDYPATFNAFFTTESAPEFMVSPKSGVMQPQTSSEDDTGTLFKVAFTPTSLSPTNYIGKLVVQSEEMEWSYRVIGKVNKPMSSTSLEMTKRVTKLNKKKL